MSDKGIMKKIIYLNEPNYDDPEKYREYIKKANNFSCSYCTITESESSGATFNIDHFKPKKLFPQYYATCSNLRYSCPRCNSYKRARWIEEKNGCIRDCDNCNNMVCHENIDRFVDGLYDDPSKLFDVDEEGRLYSVNISKPAEYTIRFLRLNRIQLIKLRKIRRYIDLWRKELVVHKQNVSTQKINVSKKMNRFDAYKTRTVMNEHSALMAEIITTMFELLEAQLIKEEYVIEEQIKRIDCLLANEYESDNVIR